MARYTNDPHRQRQTKGFKAFQGLNNTSEILSCLCLCVSVAEMRNYVFMDLDKLTYKINGAIYEVNQLLGGGFLEKVYENALLFELNARGLQAERQVPIKVTYKGIIVGDYVADIVVDNQVILELKAVEYLSKNHEAQMLNYLKATGYRVGLLVNFTYPKAEIKRFVM